MTTDFDLRIGPDEARRLIRRITAMTEPDRQTLRVFCAAKCPPGKNKQQTETMRRAA